MVERRKLLLLLIFTTIVICNALSLQKIAIAGFVNYTGRSEYDVIATTASENLSLIIRQLKNYDVSNIQYPSDEQLLNMSTSASKNDFSYLIYGQLKLDQNDDIIMVIQIYSSEKGQIILKKESPPVTVMETFSEADNIITLSLEALTGSHIGFGYVSIVIDKTGEYRLEIDGIDLGKIGINTNRVIAGKHNIVVFKIENRTESIIMNNYFEVSEGQVNTIYVYDSQKDNRSTKPQNNYLFPINGITLGLTTDDELRNLCTQSTAIDITTGEPFLFYKVDKINFYYSNKRHLAYLINLSKYDNFYMPEKWAELGMSWFMSYDEWLVFGQKMGFDAKVILAPVVEKTEGKKTLHAILQLAYIVNNIQYNITLTFLNGSGSKTSDKDTLRFIEVQSMELQ